MFKFKKKSSQEPASPTDSADFIVHNMPVTRPHILKPSGLNSSGGSDNGQGISGFGLSAPQHNFKTVGLIIIVGGFIVVSAFIYLSYRFIVKPTAETDSPALQATTTEEKSDSSPSATSSPENSVVNIVATTTVIEIATVTPDVINGATSTEELAYGEGTSGRSGSDLPPVIDSDQDGLSDDEETVLNTSATSADSDADNYSDLFELQNGYNPAGAGQLGTNPYLTKYSNASFHYETIVPKNWTSQSLNNEATVLFSAPDESLIQISVQDNADQASILNWYSQSFPDNIVTYDKLVSTDQYDGVMGEGNLNFYLTDKNRRYIIVISYIPAVNNRLAYSNIFQLIIDSLTIK